jgi:hypothetical protein
MRYARCLLLAAALFLAGAAPALTQTLDPADGWRTTVYPILAFVPINIDIEVDVPDDGGLDGGGTKIIDGRFDGAYFGAIEATNGLFRIEGGGLWAAVGGDRPDRPALSVDVDAIYFRAAAGVRLFKDLYALGGVKRFALKYNIRLGDLPELERKPGIWDPIVVLGWHSYGDTFEFHSMAEYGGFGVGSEAEFNGQVRVDWKPFSHFGFTGGYNYQYVKLKNTVAGRELRVDQTLHGPMVGIGLYF